MMLMIFWQRLRDTSSPLSSFTLIQSYAFCQGPDMPPSLWMPFIDCKEAKDGKVGLPNDRIFLSLLKTLHKEDKDDADGLLAALLDHAEVVDLKKLDETIKQSLLDRGDPIEMCKIDGSPLRAVYATHQHVGSQCNCLCAKFGMHHTQVMLDHLIRTKDEKRARETEESKVRPPQPNAFTERYQQFFCKPVLEQATIQEAKEDAQIDALEDEVLLTTLKNQLAPNTFLGTALNNKEAVVHINDHWPTKECVYTVSCGEAKRVVKLSFRGTVSLEN
jgi:hypothetical protein